MHLAHQQLFKRLDNNGGIIVIQTDYANLSPFSYRQKHTHYPIYFYPLENIRHLDGTQFIKLIKEEFPNLKKIVVGFDFHFGHLAAYDTNKLMELFDGEVEVVDEYKMDNIAIHSKVIRTYLREGNIEFANKLLGYNYTLSGLVIQGQGLGKKEFVPTININVVDFLIPEEGVYITRSILNDVVFKSVTFIGHRVTTDGKFAVETTILESFIDKEVPKNIQIEFIKKIRENRKYDKYDDLKKQINEDINTTIQWFEGKK